MPKFVILLRKIGWLFVLSKIIGGAFALVNASQKAGDSTPCLQVYYVWLTSLVYSKSLKITNLVIPSFRKFVEKCAH